MEIADAAAAIVFEKCLFYYILFHSCKMCVCSNLIVLKEIESRSKFKQRSGWKQLTTAESTFIIALPLFALGYWGSGGGGGFANDSLVWSEHIYMH